jgi:hypothetical protein
MGTMSTSRTAKKAFRGQAAIELLAYATFFLLAFVVIVSSLVYLQGQEQMRAENAYAQQVAQMFANKIYVTYTSGPGLMQRVELPADILGKPYTIGLSNRTGILYMNWESKGRNMSFSTNTITSIYDFEVSSGKIWYENLPGSGTLIMLNGSNVASVLLTNVNGTIKIEV